VSDQQITISLSQLTDLGDKIAGIDVTLDALAGKESAGKRAVVNRLVKAVQDNIDKVLAQLDEQVFSDTPDDDAFIGMYSGLVRGLESKYQKRQDEILDTRTEEIKAETPNLSEEEIKKLAEERKQLVMQFKATKEIFKTFGMPGVENVEDPKKRTGAVGKRGPRAITQFTWEVDGVRQSPDKDSLTSIAADNDYDSSKELRDAMREAKIDLKKPSDRIEFTLKNGKSLVGIKKAQEEEDDEEDDEDDDEETEETEVETATV
jgi:hypothetical protein